MNRWGWVFICIFGSVLSLLCGWLMPAHLRAVDVAVVERAGRRTESLLDRGERYANEGKLGAAQLVSQAASQEGLWGREKLALTVSNAAAAHPSWQSWGGGAAPLEVLFSDSGRPNGEAEPLTEWAIRQDDRAKALELLRTSGEPAVQQLMRCRELTNTMIFAPSQSSSGQAFDAAVSITGLLIEENKLSGDLSNVVTRAAMEANAGNPGAIEPMLLEMMALGQRMNWAQLVEFVGSMRDQQTLRRLADYVRQNEKELPVLFSAVVLSHDAGGIAEYLVNFSESGMKDIRAALRFGAGGLNELLKRNQRLYISSLQRRLAEYPGFAGVIDLASEYCWLTPWIALTIKWLLYLLSGFLLAMAMHFARPAVQELERPLQVGGFHVAREFLFALGFLVAILLLTEPFLAQQGQRTEFMFRVRLPGISSTPAAGTGSGQQTKQILMEKSLVPLGLFFVLQGLLYVGCLVKLAEIRRQRVPAKIKLRLLENEDHLFDAGLYLGFVGTIISLILFSLNIVTPSLMAAYSSTSFGIIFVSIFKIFNLRPARRRILLEAEANETASSTARQFTPA